jgi:hypothetical protein
VHPVTTAIPAKPHANWMPIRADIAMILCARIQHPDVSNPGPESPRGHTGTSSYVAHPSTLDLDLGCLARVSLPVAGGCQASGESARIAAQYVDVLALRLIPGTASVWAGGVAGQGSDNAVILKFGF